MGTCAHSTSEKTVLKLVLCASLLACLLAGARAGDDASPARSGGRVVTMKIVSFNDYHGNLETPGVFGANTLVPTVSRPDVGGAEYLQAYVAQMKAKNRNTVVVGGGDLIGATPLISALFFDEPAVETLNKIGLDFSAVGNHEFDKGKAELLRLQHGGCKVVDGATDPNSCKGFGSSAPGTFDGAKFQWLSANVVDDATKRPLLPAFGIRNVQGAKVAFIGMTLKGTPGIVTPTGVAGLTFLDEADTVNALVPRLRALGVDAIVVLVHQGGFQNAQAGAPNQPITSDINGCTGDLKNADGTDSDIRAIVKRLDDAVDLVISAHTHASYNCSANTVDVSGTSLATAVSAARPTGIPNQAGRLVPVTSASAFGRVLTEIDITLVRDRPRHLRRPWNAAHRRNAYDVVAVRPTNVLVARNTKDAAGVATPIAAVEQYIAQNPEVRDVVAAYKSAVSPLANAVIATIAAPMSNAANAAGEMQAGDLIADAQLQATQPASLGGAQIALMNAGGVRNPGFVAPSGGSYPYAVTYGNAFTVQPFGNSLVTMTLSAQQIKDLLEQQFPGCRGQTAQRIMQISSSLQYTWNPAGSCDTRIRQVAFTPMDLASGRPVVAGASENLVINGVVQNPTKTFRVTVNNFMASGGDGFSTLLGGTGSLGGAQDIDALVAYLVAFKAPAAAYDPADPALRKPRIQQGN
jgi:5'-nucleotidase